MKGFKCCRVSAPDSSGQLFRADANCDDEVDYLDYELLKSYYESGSPTPYCCYWEYLDNMTFYLYSDAQVATEITQSGNSSSNRSYVYGPNGIVCSYVDDTGPFFYLNDHLGSTRVVVDTLNNILAEYYYLPSGDAPNEIHWQENVETPLKFQGKELDNEGRFNLYYFGARYFDPFTCNWKQVDPARQFASPYGFEGGCLLSARDPNGEFAWFVPVIIGALAGGTAGGIMAEHNGVDWWKGAITGAFIGAGVGAMASPLVGATGMTTTNAAGELVATKAWGITTGIVNAANVNMGFATIGGQKSENLWKSGLVGAATGGWDVTGGLGLVKHGLSGRLAYQGIGTASQSIGNNWATGKGLFSRVIWGVGPVNLTLGKGQRLLQWQDNIGNIVSDGLGFGNALLFGGDVWFDSEHLNFTFGGGKIDKLYDKLNNDGTGAYSTFENSGMKTSRSLLIAHEAHHIWQSRSLNNQFIPNYLLQVAQAHFITGNGYDAANFYEYIAYQSKWGLY